MLALTLKTLDAAWSAIYTLPRASTATPDGATKLRPVGERLDADPFG